jgi:hypothetical protein
MLQCGAEAGFVFNAGGPELVANDPFCVSAWFKVTSRANDQKVIANKGSEFDGNNWILAFDDLLAVNPNISFTLGTTYNCILTTPLRIEGKPVLNEWHHVVAFYNPGTGSAIGRFMGIYLDNVLVALRTVPSNITIASSPGTFAIGGMRDSIGLQLTHIFRGMVGNVGVWQRMLLPSEVGDLWNGGKSLVYPFSLA